MMRCRLLLLLLLLLLLPLLEFTEGFIKNTKRENSSKIPSGAFKWQRDGQRQQLQVAAVYALQYWSTGTGVVTVRY
jgi:hypothetical protein